MSLAKTLSLADLMLNIKRDSSKWMKLHTSDDFAWQAGYFAFSVGHPGLEALRSYIDSQRERHAVRSYQDEVREFLRKYDIAFDERYVWD